MGESTMWYTKYDAAAILPAEEIEHLGRDAKAKLVPDLWVINTTSCMWMQARSESCCLPSQHPSV